MTQAGKIAVKVSGYVGLKRVVNAVELCIEHSHPYRKGKMLCNHNKLHVTSFGSESLRACCSLFATYKTTTKISCYILNRHIACGCISATTSH